jgi:UDP-galactose transporter B1
VSYWLFGVIQEWIIKTKYGENKERFTCINTLVLIQCVANVIVAKVMVSNKRLQKDTTKSWMYPACAITYVLAMFFSNSALTYVSYPTQVIGKSIKPVPVLLFGVLFAGKRYPKLKYLAILMVVAGIILFMKKDSKKSESKTADTGSDSLIGFGEILLLGSLAMDGFTGAIQDKMNAGHKPDPHVMMLNMNAWSCVYLFIAIIGSSEIFEFIVFIEKFPFVISNLVLAAFLGSVGQHFIFTTITSFGPLKCSLITTTRKFFTVLGSVFIFNNPMSVIQWSGTLLVFIGLALDSKYGKEIKHQKDKDKA